MSQSRQPQRHQPQRRSSPPPLPDDDRELRDPNEGQVPAVVEGRDVSQPGVDPQEQASVLYPQFIAPPCYTIADEQRDRSAEMQEIGILAWIDQHDSRTEEQRAESELRIENVRDDERAR